MTIDQGKMLAAIDFIRRCGASQVQIRYSDDEEPDIWFVVAIFDGKAKNPWGIKVEGVEVDASVDPLRAALRLCERLADGGRCAHCKRRCGLDPDTMMRMPLDDIFCWYQYDPGSKTFIRGCA